ncbi:MAG: hypothetical protein LBR53_08160 [Deltaproteobacteria bacterium]|jgi:hypothetical protein|nr:hypothetical protein [Deltaproteobacteria bacterium]
MDLKDRPFAAALAPVFWPIENLLFLRLSYPDSRKDELLESSLGTLGLLRAIVAAPTPVLPVVLSGARRVRALKKLGFRSAPLILLSPPPDESPCFRHPEEPEALLHPSGLELAALENLERGLNPAEVSLTAALLKHTRGRPLTERMLSLMSLGQERRFEAAARAALLPPPFLEALARGRLDLGNLMAMESFFAAEKEEVLKLFLRVGAGSQRRRQWLEYLGDLRLRDAADLEKLLTREFPPDEPPVSEGEVHWRLFRMRFPKLAETLQKRRARIRELRLPPKTALSLDDSLEDPEASLKIRFSSPRELGETLERVREGLAEDGTLLKLFETEWD